MDATEVTNAQFEKFVEATGYRTIAEIAPTKEEFPTAPPENLVAGSTFSRRRPNRCRSTICFSGGATSMVRTGGIPKDRRADIKGREKYPVVQVAYADAVAYAKWAGKRLPTEAEWEFAARGGLSGKLYAWGDELKPDGKWMANIYQGKFPGEGHGRGWLRGHRAGEVVSAQRLRPLRHGGQRLGVVQRLVSSGLLRAAEIAGRRRDAQSARPDSPYDPAEPTEKKRVHRGGSFLCTDQYCTRYMVGTRGKGEVTTASNHVGFRCVQVAN